MFHINSKRSEKVYCQGLKKIVKAKTKNEVKSAVQKIVADFPGAKLVNTIEETLMHEAVKSNNIELIKFLVDLGCNVNVKDSSGVTPLVAALSSDNFGTIEVLLNSNAEIYPDDSEIVLQMAIAKKEILPASISIALMQALKRCNGDLEAMAVLLFKLNCPIMFVVYMRDAKLTQMMLDMPNYRMRTMEFLVGLEYAIKVTDLKSLQILLKYDWMTECKMSVLCGISDLFTHYRVDWKYIKPLFARLSEWITYDNNFTWFLKSIFECGRKNDVQILLNQCNVDVQMREQYNFDVLPMLFGNRTFSTADLLQVTRERQFNVNAKSYEGWSAMHFASKVNSRSNLQLLLALNADCNLMDNRGFTPLYYCWTTECVKLLLQNGADLHITTILESTTLMDTMYEPEVTWIVMLAQLAIDHHKGIEIRETILKRINQKEMFKIRYEKCLKQVEQLQMCKVFSGCTLFDIITTKAKNITRYVQNLETISSILNLGTERFLDSYYLSALKINLEKAHDIYRSKCRVASIISQSTLIGISFDSLIIDRVFDFLTYNDVVTLTSV